MLTKIETSAMPKIKKYVQCKEVSHRSAFACGTVVDFTVEAPRRLGASAVVLRICRDGEVDRDFPFVFDKTEFGTDFYTYSLDTQALLGQETDGLFFYEILFLRGADTLFTSTRNQVDFSLTSQSENRFVLSVYRADFHTPQWFGGRVMYHIFVDRFFCGDGATEKRSDVILNEDWENGIPQYAEKNGDPLANNMFFGGNLWGIAEKLEYLKSLGVGVLYLSPIFRAYSNHKYDTGDYLEIDGMFGGEPAFRALLDKAEQLDIRIILDGVFNHTGDNSRYFDRYGAYGNEGAYGNPNSPYRSWFCFKNYPNEYETWWGIRILPKLNHENPSCRSFFTAPGGVGEKYVKMGIAGWRLDVADELSDSFLEEFRTTVKQASENQAILIGEVWENAALKVAYGKRRHYFGGKQLDSVMNYPFRNGILAFLLDKDAEFFGDILKEIYAVYPPDVCHCLMNLLGTHDTERILTVLGEGRTDCEEESNAVLAQKRLDEAQYRQGIALLKIAAAIQFTVYGVPSVFYGDEAGLEGAHDPFCRKTYPWGKENQDLLRFYQKLGKIRRQNPIFADGDFEVNEANASHLSYTRTGCGEKITVLANAGDGVWSYPMAEAAEDLLTETSYAGQVAPFSVCILKTFDGKEAREDGTVEACRQENDSEQKSEQ